MAALRYTAEEFRDLADAAFGWGDDMTAYHLLIAAAVDLEAREACTCAQRTLPDYSADDLREQARRYEHSYRDRNATQIARMLHQAADDLDAQACQADARRYRQLRALRGVPDTWLTAESPSFTDLDAEVDALLEDAHAHT